MKPLLEIKPRALALVVDSPMKAVTHIFLSLKLQWNIRQQEIRMKKRKKEWMKKLGSK